MSLKEEKTALRLRIREKREALSEDYKVTAGSRIAKAVVESELFRNAKIVFVYLSTQEEPDTKEILETALFMEKTVCVPKCHGKGRMTPVVIHSFSDLQPGMYGILEPIRLENTVEEREIELGIIPCVSANKKGERIGHGAGYYDRFFEKSSCTTMCLCFEELLSENIPMGKIDRRMDYLVTEDGPVKI